MLVLLITLVPIINLNADSYVSNDNVLVSSSVHDFFTNYFSPKDTYKYFPYECGDRTCYLGINSNTNEFVRLYYTGSYSSNLQIQKGVDNDFDVSGINVFIHEPVIEYDILISIVFIFLICLFLNLIGGGIRVK